MELIPSAIGIGDISIGWYFLYVYINVIEINRLLI